MSSKNPISSEMQILSSDDVKIEIDNQGQVENKIKVQGTIVNIGSNSEIY